MIEDMVSATIAEYRRLEEALPKIHRRMRWLEGALIVAFRTYSRYENHVYSPVRNNLGSGSNSTRQTMARASNRRTDVKPI